MFGSPRIKTVLTCSDTQLRLDPLGFSFFGIHTHPELVLARPGRNGYPFLPRPTGHLGTTNSLR